MKKRLIVPVALAMLMSAALVKVQTATGEAPTLVGTSKCVMCHKNRDTSVSTYDGSKHAASMKVAGVAGNADCEKCHATGGKATDVADAVTCEACHGAGSGYKSIMSKSPDRYDAGLITPSVAVCVQCHNKEYKDFKGFAFQAYLLKVRHGNEDALKNAPSAPLAYVGKAKCAMCHKSRDNSVAQLDASAHSKALEALSSEAAKKIDPDAANNVKCLACHVTGLGDPGGYDPAGKAEDNEKVAGVQCESCHGPGEKYKGAMSAKDDYAKNGLVKPSEKTCRKCHNALSPSFKGFKYEEMLAKIAHKKN